MRSNIIIASTKLSMTSHNDASAEIHFCVHPSDLRLARFARPVLINGTPGILVLPEGGAPLVLLAFTVRNGLITRLDVLTDRQRLARLDLSALGYDAPKSGSTTEPSGAKSNPGL